jgi:hypothetical protein
MLSKVASSMQPLKVDPVRDTGGNEELLGFMRDTDVLLLIDRGNPAMVIF